MGYYISLETDTREDTYGTATVLLLKKTNYGGYVIQKITSRGISAEEFKVSVTDVYPNSYKIRIQELSEGYPDSIRLANWTLSRPSFIPELINLQIINGSFPYMSDNSSSSSEFIYFKISGIETPEDIKNLEASYIAKEKAKKAEDQARFEKERSDYLLSNDTSIKLVTSLLGNKNIYFISQASEFGWTGPLLFKSEILPDGETIRFTSLSDNRYLSRRNFLLSWDIDDDTSDFEKIRQYFGENLATQNLIKFNPIVDADLGGRWLLRIRKEIFTDLKEMLDMYGLESDYCIYLIRDEGFPSPALYIVVED